MNNTVNNCYVISDIELARIGVACNTPYNKLVLVPRVSVGDAKSIDTSLGVGNKPTTVFREKRSAQINVSK